MLEASGIAVLGEDQNFDERLRPEQAEDDVLAA